MNQKRKEAIEKLNNMKTFGMMILEARDKCGMSRLTLSEKLSTKKLYASEREISLWEKDAKYPDITTIYALSEFLKINPTDLLEAKQLFQEAGLSVIDMVTMRVVCKIFDISIMGIFYLNRILIWVILIGILISVWAPYAEYARKY